MRPVLRIPDRVRFGFRQYRLKGRKLRWQLLASRNGSLVSELQPGLKMRLYGDSELCHLIYCRHFEANEREFLNRFLRPGDVFVDVGANIGLFTLIAAERTGLQGKVLAFEPTAKTFGRLVENVRLNKFTNVECLKLALSDSRGNLPLNQCSEGYDAWNSLAKPVSKGSLQPELVEAVDWDQFAQERDLIGSVTMMKIDVEGWENRVLAGGKQFFSRSDAPVLQVEFTDEAAEAAGASCRALYDCLQSYGYKMFLYDSGERRLVTESRREKYPYLNLLAAKDPEFVQRRLQSAACPEIERK